MLLNFDFYIIFIFFVLCVLIMTGYVSLCERKILAVTQMRVGPALCFFGILTPITDGLKLFIKFIIFVIGFDWIYLLLIALITLLCVFVIWLMIPLSYIILVDLDWTIFVILFIHLTETIFSYFIYSFILAPNIYVYLAGVRILIFLIFSETLNFFVYFCFYLLDTTSFFSIKNVSISQIFCLNFYFLGFLFFFCYYFINTLNNLKLPFDYAESESELVAGFVTEFSGAFFVLFSVSEISNLLITTILISTFCFGGLNIILKSLFVLCFLFLIPRVISFRIKITTAQIFIIFFLYFIIVILFLWIFFIKIICFLI